MSDSAPPAAPAPPEATAPEWQRLSRRMLLVHPVQEIPRALPALIGVVVAGSRNGNGDLWGLLGLAVTIGLGLMRWFTTRYRVTEDRVEVRQGLLRRRLLAVSRDRVRTVDVTSHALHRLLGLTRVKIGTGRSDRERGGEVRLDGLTVEVAAHLRDELLHRRGAGRPGAAAGAAGARAGAAGAGAGAAGAGAGAGAGAAGAAGAATVGAAVDDAAAFDAAELPATELARLDPSWVRFGPFTLSGVVAVGVVAGFAANFISEAHIDLREHSALRGVVDTVRDTPVGLAVLVGLVIGMVVVAIASTVGYVLAFWDFRLTRDPRGTLHITRGLITTRATTIEERRLHGVELSEPLLLRAARGAR